MRLAVMRPVSWKAIRVCDPPSLQSSALTGSGFVVEPVEHTLNLSLNAGFYRQLTTTALKVLGKIVLVFNCNRSSRQATEQLLFWVCDIKPLSRSNPLSDTNEKN